MIHPTDTIVALSTPSGEGALGVVRLSGPDARRIADRIFCGKDLLQVPSHTIHYGTIRTSGGKILDECLVSVFIAPRSYTKEDMVEFSCHGSSYILEGLVRLLITEGARYAEPGEFTKRAFLHGQLDLSQAEAVAELIAADTGAQHRVALSQLRGGISDRIKNLRSRLIKFASLIELENDFSEEDVEFADRTALKDLVTELMDFVQPLIRSFAYGNALKKGVAVAIVGAPNVGKSTLLNALLQEEKAIVSAIPGTTRDVIEDSIRIDGILYRFIDTAGLRSTEDEIEAQGIRRSYEQITKADIVLYMSVVDEDTHELAARFKELNLSADQKAIILLNKADQYKHLCHRYDIQESVSSLCGRRETLLMSAKRGDGLDSLKQLLVDLVRSDHLSDQMVITNLRHYEALRNTLQSLQAVQEGLSNDLPSDLIALDLRHAMHALGTISGEIYSDDLLDSIFRDFCIGK